MGKKWNSDAGPGEKLLRLFSLLLFTGTAYSLTSLAQSLACSKQTVLRLIDQLEASGWATVLREDVGRAAYYRIQRPSLLPAVSLNPEGLAQLALCRSFLQHLLPSGMQTSADIALQQAGASFSPEEAQTILGMSRYGSSFIKGKVDYSRAYAHLDILLRSAMRNAVCELSYRASASRAPRTFDFAPMYILFHNESLYVLGWEVTDKGTPAPVYADPTHLLLHRIQNVLQTRRVWKNLPPVDVDGDLFGLIREAPFHVIVRITSDEAMTYVAERTWSEDQTITHNDDGSLTLSLTAQSQREILSWILSLGSSAQVLEPDWLVEQIREEATRLCALYEDRK